MSEHPTFLLVEDDNNDVLLIKRSFLKARVLNPLQLVTTGEDAIAYLSGQDKYANRLEFPLPALVLLDIQMPGVDGFQVLTWIRQQPALSAIRVVMLTFSDAMRDVNLAYQLGANSFLIKPVDFDRFVEVSQAFGGCWSWNQAPRDIESAPEASSDSKERLRKTDLGMRRFNLP